jgi:hypothetical protein
MGAPVERVVMQIARVAHRKSRNFSCLVTGLKTGWAFGPSNFVRHRRARLQRLRNVGKSPQLCYNDASAEPVGRFLDEEEDNP